MKKTLVTAIALMICISLNAQNIQLHRDFGKDRNYFTSTLEMFKPDKWGSTFWFVDMNYGGKNMEGVSLAYWEIARGLKFWEFPMAIEAEYNGGFGRWSDGTIQGTYTINSAWLGGFSYLWNNEDFTRGITAKGLYKFIQNKHNASFQITLVWYAYFFNKKLSFMGFADFWREDNFFVGKTTKFVFLSEPQLWYNFTENISLGGEVEFSYNFGGLQGFNALPTLAAKWTF